MEIFLLVLIGGGAMAWAVGANDVANAMGTSVGSKAISFRQAIVIAAIFEVLGALFAGQEVTSTIQKGLISTESFQDSPRLLMMGMISALYASALWLILASSFGWPVSTTHSIVGSILGFGLVTQGATMLPWDTISQIALGWVVSPIISAVTAWVVFRFIQAFIFSCDDPLGRVIFMAPICMAVILMVFLRIVLIGVAQSSYVYGVFVLSVYAIDLVVFSMGPIAYFFTRFWLSSYISVAQDNQSVMLSTVERVFAVLVVMTASVMAFSHGANDVANAIGPMVSALNILRSGNVEFMGVVPIWIMLWGALGVAIGVSTYGYKVMQRVGNDITTLSPSRSFAAQLATGIVVLSASHLGFPVSTTQILVGGVMGVGLARGLAAIDLSVVKGIFLSWLITIPSGAMLSIVIYRIFEIVL